MSTMTITPNQPHLELRPLSGFATTGFYSISEAAAITKTGEETIRRAIRAGRIPAYGSRGRLRVRLCDVMPQYAPQRKRMNSAKA